jgi:hypothetical protein
LTKTSTWLPIVWVSLPFSAKIGRAGSHDAPPLVDRANQASEWKLAAFSKPLCDTRSLGEMIRCHVAYTSDESNGSAVSVSLSLKALPTARGLSNRTIRGVLHVTPPSVENAARTAFRAVELSNTRAIACNRPFGLNDSHGSVPRS